MIDMPRAVYSRVMLHSALAPALAVALIALHPSVALRAYGAGALEKHPIVHVNDNRRPAGTLANGTLTIALRAGAGLLRPEGERGAMIPVESFGEDGGPLQAPGPLIRVPQGTTIVASIRNVLDVTLRVHGLCARDGRPCAPIEVAPATSREVRFDAGLPGTYHYWGTTTGMPLQFRAAPDTQLSGAFIVDAPGVPVDMDRVLVISDWTSLTRAELRTLADADDPGALFRQMNPRFTGLLNGLSWPATERLTYRLGDDVRWRVINLSTQAHPMHLHGFYFDVMSRGDGVRERVFAPEQRPRVVTEVLQPGGTMTMMWRPERAGNWLFHCHLLEHVSPLRRLTPMADGHAHHAAAGHAAGMAGMVWGVTVLGANDASAATRPAVPTRELTLVMQTEAKRYGAEPAYGFVLKEPGHTVLPDTVSVPGPPIVLRRGEPVEIALVNRLPEATAIHWHGMELESYYDGVHGWSGAGTRVTPMIEPGDSFKVRFTPPRAGTFIYHTHLHDERQLASGMYGALIVLDPGETFDPATDHVMVIGRGGPGRAPALLNGTRESISVWKAGATHRIRFINITPSEIYVASLSNAEGPVAWRPLSKDGAPVPSAASEPTPATQVMAPGETFDFEYVAPTGRQSLWLNLRTPGGRWEVQGRVVIK
jgi:manganese oxidase